MKNIKLIILVVASVSAIFAFSFYRHSRVDELEDLIPKGRMPGACQGSCRVDQAARGCVFDAVAAAS
ncbi:hypothetical protein, partial [Paracidovorax avenae]|uniref:hypothetical protein n=1 Tax=Paracidovorax avenae TaxID=80867 RepID=UPI001F1A563E